MKPNKEKVYDFIKLHGASEKNGGVSTSYIAEALNMQRTNVSSILNLLVEEGRVDKSNGRPVLYRISRWDAEGKADCFAELTGCEGSLKHVVQLAKAAMLYPEHSLNSIIVGARGTGKSQLARMMYQFSIEQEILLPTAPYVQINCREYMNDEARALRELFGEEEGLVASAKSGILYLDNIQYLSSSMIKRLVKYIQSSGRDHVVIVSCTDKNQLGDEDFLAEFPIMMELPTLVERPLTERMEMVKKLLSLEAARIKRTLVVKEDLIRCLLLYECDANYHQLKGDIKIGCANAYVREYKSSDEIQLYVSDFEHHVRKGFLRYRMYRKEIADLIPSDYSYSFDGNTVSINESASNNLYEQISKKATLLNDNGLDEDEINLLLSAEVERSFQKYQKELVRDVTNKEQLSILVDEKLIELVEEFLQNAESKLDRRFSSSVFYGLCLHIKAVVNHREEPKKLDKNQITDILSNYKKEYLLSAELAEKIGKAYDMEIPLDEIILITMFICYQSEAAPQSGKPVVLFAFYGEGVATAIVKTIVSLTQLDNVFSFELAYEKDSAEVYDALKAYIASIHQGKGIFVVYDSSFLSEMLSEIEDELGIFIRQFPAPIMTMGIELARKALAEDNIDKVYQEALKDLNYLTRRSKNYIVTLCTTGKGGAEELKRYIEKFGQLNDTEVVPLAISDRETLSETFKKLMKNGVISCVVGTFDPKLFSIPFISISEVFGIKKENLPKLLKLEKQAKAQIDYNAMFEYLNEQLEHVNIMKLKRLLPEVLDAINANITELSLDTEVGLLIHISCCIDRLMGKGTSAANPRKKMILTKYKAEFNQLLKIFKPVEKTFGIIISDDEIANILTIIYQL
ncbi:MAG: PRD domain-containing protein [Agathobacter sp.]|nr:PRD domain-containing protein [Agathobacter sp.]